MNKDHADALLAIAQVQGGATDATQARILGMTIEQLEFVVGEASAEKHLTIAIHPPIDPLDTVCASLVAMTRDARQALTER